MAQHDYVIANGTGAAVRSDFNNALAAIVSQNSGATAPATTYAYQFWADTTTGLLKLRNSANSAWITLFQLDGEWSTLPVENGTAAAPSIYFKDSGTDTGIFSPGADSVAITTGGTQRATVDSSGRLLVGTSSAFSAAGFGTPNNQFVGDYQQSTILLRNNVNDTSACGLVFQKIRTTSIVQQNDPLGYLTFNGYDGVTDRAGAYIFAAIDSTPGSGDLPTRLVFSTTADGASSPTERMRIGNDGATYFGVTAAPSGSVGGSAFLVESDSRRTLYMASTTTGGTTLQVFRNPNGQVGSITTSGSATAFNTSSDYRLKENVATVTDGITRLQQLKPSRFNFKADPSHTVDGFIAHEAQAVVPECVTGTKDEVDADGNPIYQGIDQSKLVPLLTAALQEAIGEIESLKARLTAAGI